VTFYYRYETVRLIFFKYFLADEEEISVSASAQSLGVRAQKKLLG
jgi:hypothetical protein